MLSENVSVCFAGVQLWMLYVHNEALGFVATVYGKLMTFAEQSAVCKCAITAH